MENKIIIIGSGRATLLHLIAFTRIWSTDKMPKIFIVKGDVILSEVSTIVNKYRPHIQFITYNQIASDINNTVIDICTPTSTHKFFIEKMNKIGFKKFIVEKPLVTKQADIQWLATLDIQIEVVHNYKFSKATTFLRQYLLKNKIRPKLMFSHFCKDRRSDTKNRRGGYQNESPHVLTIETPHQTYLSTLFMGNGFVSSLFNQPIQFVGDKLINAGAGGVQFSHFNSRNDNVKHIKSVHFSCMQSKRCIKQLILFADEQYVIKVIYPTDMELRDSNIIIYQGEVKILKKTFKDDDMMKFALKYYYYQLINRGKPLDKEQIIKDASIIVDCIEPKENVREMCTTDEVVCRNCAEWCDKYSIRLPCNKVQFGNEYSQYNLNEPSNNLMPEFKL